MNNIDEWLNSLGFDEEPQPATENFPSTEPITEPAEPIEPSTQELSDNDFDDILSDLGFSEVQEAEIVEEDDEDEEGEEEVENTPTEEELMQANRISISPYIAERFHVSVDIGDGSVPLEGLNPEPTPPAPAPLIQPNSPTLLMNDATSRFSGTEWYNEIQRKRIIIAGMGGIGRLKKFLYLCTE